ncbi:MAG TPA: serine/threonine-protein kinase [Stenomitos sp.]
MNLTAGAALNKGKYLLIAHLGQDVLTLTYRAIDTESGQAVVIRTLTENWRQHSEVDRLKPKFLALAERLKRLKHPNLVQVLDIFEDAGCPYVVMEYVSGETLAELIQRSVTSEAKAIDYIRQVSNALSSLHKAGLLHRNIKPQNMIRQENSDRVVLGELGMFCEFFPEMMPTQTDGLSAGYAPLELYSQEPLCTAATDIYSLAATLYTLLYRNSPLPAPVRQKLQADGGDRLFLQNSHHVTPKLSQAVKRAIWRGLEISAQKRPQTVDAWLSLLPKLEQTPTPQAPLQDCLIAQSKVKPEALLCPSSGQIAAQSPPANGKTSASPTPQPAMGQLFVTKLQTLVHFKNTNAIKFNLLHERTVKLSCTPKKNSPQKTSLLRALLLTGAIAASAGLGFGFALRVNGPQAPGSTFLHTEQSFPPRSDWPVAKPRL